MSANDLTIYSEYATEWWTPGAPRFRSLQNLTPFRLSLIEEHVGPLAGKRVYDVGCGGGLLSVPLLDRGATVVGIDISAQSITAAARAAQGRGRFIVGDARSLPFPDCSAEIVLLADVVDHLPDYERALSEAARVLVPGGRLFVGTINRTVASYFGAILLGEGLRLIPPGTHDWNLFIQPKELIARAQAVGLTLRTLQGEQLRLWETVCRWAISLKRSSSTALAYSAVFEKPLQQGEIHE